MYVSSRGWILFLAMSIIWGVPYLMIKVAVEGVSVPVLVLARTAVGAAVLLPLAFSRQTLTIVRNHWRALLGFAFFEIIAAWWLLSDAERHLTSSMTGLLIAASLTASPAVSDWVTNESSAWQSASAGWRCWPARTSAAVPGRSSRC
jgi:drug/metabolite transporter (DMT)-like permease